MLPHREDDVAGVGCCPRFWEFWCLSGQSEALPVSSTGAHITSEDLKNNQLLGIYSRCKSLTSLICLTCLICLSPVSSVSLLSHLSHLSPVSSVSHLSLLSHLSPVSSLTCLICLSPLSPVSSVSHLSHLSLSSLTCLICLSPLSPVSSVSHLSLRGSEDSLGLRRILSQSTESLNFRSRTLSMESLTDDGLSNTFY